MKIVPYSPVTYLLIIIIIIYLQFRLYSSLLSLPLFLITMNRIALFSSLCLSAALLCTPVLQAQTLTWQGQSVTFKHTPRNIAVYELSA